MKNKAYIAAVLFSIFIGLSFLFMKISLGYADTLLILSHRFAIGLIGFALYRIYKGHSLKVSKKDLVTALPIAIFYPVLFFFFQGIGLNTLSSSEAGMIHATVPIMTLILSAFLLKENTTLLQKISVVLSVTGVIYIFSMKGIKFGDMDQVGIIFALLSAIASAIYGLLARKRLQNYSYIDLTYIIMVVGFIAFHIFYLVVNYGQVSITRYFSPLLKINYVVSVLYLGMFASVLSSLFSNYAISIIPVAQISVFNNFATLVSIGAGYIFLQEPLYSYHFVGGLLIILGVIGTNMGKVTKSSLNSLKFEKE